MALPVSPMIYFLCDRVCITNSLVHSFGGGSHVLQHTAQGVEPSVQVKTLAWRHWQEGDPAAGRLVLGRAGWLRGVYFPTTHTLCPQQDLCG